MQSTIATPMPARLSTMSPLYPPPAHGELLPVEHNLALIPALIADGDLTVFCCVSTGCGHNRADSFGATAPCSLLAIGVALLYGGTWGEIEKSPHADF